MNSDYSIGNPNKDLNPYFLAGERGDGRRGRRKWGREGC